LVNDSGGVPLVCVAVVLNRQLNAWSNGLITKNLLVSDIDPAERLIKAGGEDHGVIAALGKRGIEVANATRLVQDLRGGLQVKPELYATATTRESRQPHRSKR
jgi:hypothetical protein